MVVMVSDYLWSHAFRISVPANIDAISIYGNLGEKFHLSGKFIMCANDPVTMYRYDYACTPDWFCVPVLPLPFSS
jgi:hypothetical protein